MALIDRGYDAPIANYEILEVISGVDGNVDAGGLQRCLGG
jgi:hypothetical protein